MPGAELSASNDHAALREQILIGLFSALSAIIMYAAIAAAVFNTYKPDVAAFKKIGDELLISNTLVRPEPMEAMLTRIALIIIPACLVAFYHLFSKAKFIARLAAGPFFTAFSTLCVTGVIMLAYAGFSARNPFGEGAGDLPQTVRDHRGGSNFDFYFGGLFPGNYLLLYMLIICPLVATLFFIGFKRYRWDESAQFRLWVKIAGYTFIAAAIGSCLPMCTFRLPYLTENKFDFSSVYYSMTQVYAGSPMLVDGFTNTYGLYPHFLNPLFQVIGLSVFKFSLAMSLLLCLAFALNFWCLKQFVRNDIIRCMGMFTVLFFSFFDFKFTENFDALFALYSIRYIIPSVLFFLACRYLKKRSQFRYWSTTIIMACFVLWNPELGMVCYLAWLVFLSFTGFYNDEGRPALKKILFTWGTGIVVLIVVVFAFMALIFLFYGALPDISALWSAIFIFGKYGFNLLPMALLHPWNLMALTILAGLVYSISHWYKKDIAPRAAVVLMLCVIASGFFLYFQGRSHNWNFAFSSGMGLLLLTILADELWLVARTRNLPALNLLFFTVLCILSYSGIGIVANAGKIYSLFYQEKDKETGRWEQNIIEQGKEFIAANSEPHEKIYVFTLRKFQDLFFDGDKRVSAFNPGMIDLFLNSDVARMEQQLVDSSFKVFITPKAFFNLWYMTRSLANIGATYERTSGNETIVCAEKRKIRIPTPTFFSDHPETVIHRKYSDDSIGTALRINDAFGIKPVTLNSEFSIQILFNSRPQVFAISTLAGTSDSLGFLISVSGDKGLFAVNGICSVLAMPAAGWVYCVMNVFSDHFDVYENGTFIGGDTLARPVINTADKFCIGNLGHNHNYVGAISEVALCNKAIDSNEVIKTTGEIRNYIISGKQ